MAMLTYRAYTSVRLRFIPSSLNIATWFPAFWNSPALWVPANPQPLTDNRPPTSKAPNVMRTGELGPRSGERRDGLQALNPLA
jgi:hypothetical protein